MDVLLRSFEVAQVLIICFSLTDSRVTMSMEVTSEEPDYDYGDQTTDSYNPAEDSTSPPEPPPILSPVIWIAPLSLIAAALILVCLICGLCRHRRKSAVDAADPIPQRDALDVLPVAMIPAASRVIRLNHPSDIAMDVMKPPKLSHGHESLHDASETKDSGLYAMPGTSSLTTGTRENTDCGIPVVYNKGKQKHQKAPANQTSAAPGGTERGTKYAKVCRSQGECGNHEGAEGGPTRGDVPIYGVVNKQRVYDDPPPTDVISVGVRGVTYTDRFRGAKQVESTKRNFETSNNGLGALGDASNGGDSRRSSSDGAAMVYNDCYGGVSLGDEHVMGISKFPDRNEREQAYEYVGPSPEESEMKDGTRDVESEGDIPVYSEVKMTTKTVTD